jgi:hypothetical protein
VIQRNGWNLLFHKCRIEQLHKWHAAAERAQKQDPKGSVSNANVRLFAALAKLIFEVVPSNPNREEYWQGNNTVVGSTPYVVCRVEDPDQGRIANSIVSPEWSSTPSLSVETHIVPSSVIARPSTLSST